MSTPVKFPSETIISASNKPAEVSEVKSKRISPVPVPVAVNVEGTSNPFTFALKLSSSSELSTSSNVTEKDGL